MCPDAMGTDFEQIYFLSLQFLGSIFFGPSLTPFPLGLWAQVPLPFITLPANPPSVLLLPSPLFCIPTAIYL